MVLLDRKDFCSLVRDSELWKDRKQYANILNFLFYHVHFSWFIESADIFGLDNSEGTVFSIYNHLSRQFYCLEPKSWESSKYFENLLEEIGEQIMSVFKQTQSNVSNQVQSSSNEKTKWNLSWHKQLAKQESSSKTKKILSYLKKDTVTSFSEDEKKILLLNLNWGLFLSKPPSSSKELERFLKFPLVFCKTALERFLGNYWLSGNLYNHWKEAFD